MMEPHVEVLLVDTGGDVQSADRLHEVSRFSLVPPGAQMGAYN
jgi:hypothetical protein